MLLATAACNFSTSELRKVLRGLQFCGVLYIFTSECAFRHSGVQFFDISFYKSGPNTSCFVHFHFRIAPHFSTSELQKEHFHFRMCFSPQRRAIFQHQRLQKCSRNAVFCTFSLPNVLFATAACNFSTLARTKVVQTPHVLCIFTSKYAFHHSGVQFLIYTLTT